MTEGSEPMIQDRRCWRCQQPAPDWTLPYYLCDACLREPAVSLMIDRTIREIHATCHDDWVWRWLARHC
jgi:hypothetical protein